MKPPPGPPTLQRLLNKWQPRLGLADWRIQIRWARASEVTGYWAQSQWWELDQSGLIKVLRKEDAMDGASETAGWTFDLEEVVVHELVHAHLHVLARAMGKEPPHMVLEQVTDALARAIVGR